MAQAKAQPVPAWRSWLLKYAFLLLGVIGWCGIAGMYYSAKAASFAGVVASFVGMFAGLIVMAVLVITSENCIRRR